MSAAPVLVVALDGMPEDGLHWTVWNIPPEAGGSGFLISPEGLVATNFHVIEGASELMVQVGDDPRVRVRRTAAGEMKGANVHEGQLGVVPARLSGDGGGGARSSRSGCLRK